VKISKRQLRRIIREAMDYPAGYEPTNVDRVYELIQPLFDQANTGLDRQGEIAMEIADLYDASTENPHEILNHAESILKTDAGYYEESEFWEAAGSTKKYDDDSALKGKQSELPDGLQKGIIDKTVEDREEREEEEKKEKNEGVDSSNMPDSWRQILGDCLK